MAGRLASVTVGFAGCGRGEVARPLVPGEEGVVAVVEGGAGFGDVGGGLFKPEGYVLSLAQIADVTRPCVGHGAKAGAGFASNNEPVVSSQIDILRPGADKRFGAYEEGGGGAGAEGVEAVDDAGIFDAGAHPHVGRPFFDGPGGGEFRALGQYLEGVLGKVAHDGEDLATVFVGDEGVEEVGHGIDEDSGGFFEFVGVAELVGFEQDVFGFVLLCPRLFCPAVFEAEAFGVAVAAAVADAGAAVDGIPGYGCPADRGLIHDVILLFC